MSEPTGYAPFAHRSRETTHSDRVVRVGESGTDSPEQTHPDTRQWAVTATERNDERDVQV